MDEAVEVERVEAVMGQGNAWLAGPQNLQFWPWFPALHPTVL